jgi:hypothetical protein
VQQSIEAHISINPKITLSIILCLSLAVGFHKKSLLITLLETKDRIIKSALQFLSSGDSFETLM